jgi:hypothetical protein
MPFEGEAPRNCDPNGRLRRALGLEPAEERDGGLLYRLVGSEFAL